MSLSARRYHISFYQNPRDLDTSPVFREHNSRMRRPPDPGKHLNRVVFRQGMQPHAALLVVDPVQQYRGFGSGGGAVRIETLGIADNQSVLNQCSHTVQGIF